MGRSLPDFLGPKVGWTRLTS